MQVRSTFIALAAILVASTESKPILPEFYISSYQHPESALNAHPQFLQYQDAYSPYYIYNVHTDVKAIPASILPNGKPAVSHVPAYNLYYGTPVYDFRFPLNPVFPVLRPQHPGLLPKPTAPPTSTMRPFDDDDDGIEKLDTKVEPEAEMKKPSNEESEADDSITIDAI